MLKLLLGGSGSGKTTLLYQRIRARAEAGEKSILLVPEQFTSSTEGRIHRELGDALSGLVESFSFTSLAEHILSAEGGSAVQTLSDAGRAVLVRRALEELQDNVHYYYRPQHRRQNRQHQNGRPAERDGPARLLDPGARKQYRLPF